jgi:hypothetical protein
MGTDSPVGGRHIVADVHVGVRDVTFGIRNIRGAHALVPTRRLLSQLPPPNSPFAEQDLRASAKLLRRRVSVPGPVPRIRAAAMAGAAVGGGTAAGAAACNRCA